MTRNASFLRRANLQRLIISSIEVRDDCWSIEAIEKRPSLIKDRYRAERYNSRPNA